MKLMMSAGTEELEVGGIANALVACDQELEEDDITLLMSRLCPKPYNGLSLVCQLPQSIHQDLTLAVAYPPLHTSHSFVCYTTPAN